MITLQNLDLSFGSHSIFSDLNVTIRDGEVVGVIAPSGTGKSMMLRCMTMLQRPTGGKIFLDDQEITAPGADLDNFRQRIGMVFQDFNLFNHMSILENVMSGLVHLQNYDQETAYRESMKLLRRVGLADKAFFMPQHLSGGQQQRAAIARTLAMKPEVILMDEPTSSLDPMAKGEVESVIRMLASEGHTMVIISHEMDLIKHTCSRVLFLYNGKVHEEGTPEKIFDDPDRTQTRRFVQALRVLELDVQSKDFDFIGVQTTLAEYAYRTEISADLLRRMQSILEELFDMVIIQPEENNRMHISLEYNHHSKSISADVHCSGQPIDPDDPLYFLSWPIICKRASEVSLQTDLEGEYTNRILMKVE